VTTHHHLKLRLRIHATILPVHPYTFQACTGTDVLGDTVDNIQSTAAHAGVVCLLHDDSTILSMLGICSLL